MLCLPLLIGCAWAAYKRQAMLPRVVPVSPPEALKDFSAFLIALSFLAQMKERTWGGNTDVQYGH
jgi:hypothetical protein